MRVIRLPIFVLMLWAVTAYSSLAVASDGPTTSAMASYIQNARTPDDHEYIASLFDLQAGRAQSKADSYTNQIACQNSQTAELGRRDMRSPGLTAQRRCRKLLRHYTNEARQLRGLADHHRKVAADWREASL